MTTTIIAANRSKKYRANLAKITEAYGEATTLSIEDAVESLLTLDHAGFKDGVSVELHVNLNINATKSDQLVRSSVVLPHGTGKTKVIAAFVTGDKEDEAKKAGAQIVGGEDLVAEIKKEGKVNFDIAIAQPEMMKKIPAIARILGTSGVMPNPKTGTVGDDITGMIELINKGKVDFKNDKSGNVHIPAGKINKSFSKEQLIENITAALEAVEKAKPDAVKRKFVNSAFICAAMSPSIRIK